MYLRDEEGKKWGFRYSSWNRDLFSRFSSEFAGLVSLGH